MSDTSFLTEGLDTAPAPAETAPSAPEGNVEQNIAAALQAKAPEGTPKPEEKPAEPAKVKAWFEDFEDEELRGDPNVTKHSSPEGLAKAYKNAVKLLGADKVVLPKDENDAEGWDRLYKAAGRPDKPEDYAIERATDLPEGMQWDEDGESFLRSYAISNGLNQKQVANLADLVMKQRVDAHRAAMDAQNRYNQERNERITRELGDQLPAYKSNAQAVMQEYGDADLVAFLNESKLGDDPRFIKMFGRMGKELLGDSRLKAPEKSQAVAGGDLQTQIAKFREKNSKALYDKMHPGHASAVAQLTEMSERLYGTEPVR